LKKKDFFIGLLIFIKSNKIIYKQQKYFV